MAGSFSGERSKYRTLKEALSSSEEDRLHVTWVLFGVYVEGAELCSIPDTLEGAARGFISVVKGV